MSPIVLAVGVVRSWGMDLAPFKLERYFAQFEFTAQYLLCSSDCESWSVRDLLGLEPGSTDRFLDLRLGYTESLGSPSLREEIAKLYTTVRPDELFVCSGAEEAVFLFMQAALHAGDHVIVHSPCYQSLAEIPRSIGCEVTFWKAREENGWALDLAELKRLLRSDTRAVVVNLPHNPTGFLMRPNDFYELTRMAAARGFFLFSDEVYREAEYAETSRLPAAVDLAEEAVSLGVMSKTYGLPGLRIGWVATHDAELYASMARLKDYTTICNSAPSEFLAEIALRHRSVLVRRNVEILLANLYRLDGFFSRHPNRFSWVRPGAGPIAFPRLIGEDDEAFCRDLMKYAGVLLLPGSLYDDPKHHVRFGFGRKNLPEALGRLEEFLQSRRVP